MISAIGPRPVTSSTGGAGLWHWHWAGGEDLQLPPHTAGFVHFMAATPDQYRDRAAMPVAGLVKICSCRHGLRVSCTFWRRLPIITATARACVLAGW
jgi:hypothetical protein